jgi:hypothetical protein
MPARYHEGARKAYNTGRSRIYTDVESVFSQKEKERMIREQIKRKKGPRPRKLPANWTKFERLTKTGKRKLINIGSVFRG